MPGARTPADMTSLLMELSRALKGYQFYPDGHPQLKETLERSLRSWQSNLENFGPLELDVQRGCFRLTGSKMPFGKGTLDDLSREFAIRGIRRIRAEAELASESFQGLMELLRVESDILLEGGGAGQWLIENQVPGLTLNEADLPHPLSEGADTEGDESEPDALDPELNASPLVADLRAGQGPEEVAAEEDDMDCPVERPSDSEVEELLEFLDACRDDAPYEKLVDRLFVHFEGADLSYIGRDRYKSLYTFQRHINEAGSRSAAQRGIARQSLQRLCPESITHELIQHSFTQPDGTRTDPASILLELRERCARELIAAIDQEKSPARREQIQEFLTGLGQAIIPDLKSILKQGSPSHVRIAARTAGLLQAESAVPALCNLLQGKRDDMCKEAVHALVRIGGREALTALTGGLNNSQPNIASISAFGLGLWETPEALNPLRIRLRKAVDNAPTEVVLDLLRAIGKIGRTEASGDLTEILHRRSILQRARLKEIQLGAVAALSKIPSEGAQHALQEASHSGYGEIRKAAKQALDQLAARTP
jgi:HEAT repeat protein